MPSQVRSACRSRRVLGAVATAAVAVFGTGPGSVVIASTDAHVPCAGPHGGGAGLAEAITNANNSVGGGTITLAAGCAYAGATSWPTIITTITITGLATTLAGALHVDDPTATLTLNGITVPSIGLGEGSLTVNRGVVTHGIHRNPTAAVYSMTLNSSRVSGSTGIGVNDGIGIEAHNDVLTLNNTVVFGSRGGGIVHCCGLGSVTLINSTVSGNGTIGKQLFGAPVLPLPDAGGGIASDVDTTLINTTVVGNVADHCGGISHTGGVLHISRSNVSDNLASGHGGGLCHEAARAGDTMTIAGSTISGNALGLSFPGTGYGGGLVNDGSATITGSVVSGNTAVGPYGISDLGGGVASRGSLTVTGSSFVGNQSNAGGAMAFVGTLALDHSTVAGNAAYLDCGGIRGYRPSITVSHSFIAGNFPDLVFRSPSNDCTA